jgi:hypothetical protein
VPVYFATPKSLYIFSGPVRDKKQQRRCIMLVRHI